MRRFLLLALTLLTLGLAGLPLAHVASAAPARGALTAPTAHRSGCHRWHSCASDRGSYGCGDTGYTSQCPGGVPTTPPPAPPPVNPTPSPIPPAPPAPPSTGTGYGGSSGSGSGGSGSTGTTYGTITMPTHTVLVNTDSLKLRSGPGATYSSARSYARGTVLTYLGKSSSGLWVHVSRSGVTGWMMAQYVIVR